MDIEPGVGTSLSNGWQRMWPNFGPLFLIFLIYILFGLPNWIFSFFSGLAQLPPFTAYFISMVYSVLILYPLGYGVAYAALRAARGERPWVPDLFAPFENYWAAVFAYILVVLLTIVGIFLFIIPGVIIACKLAFVPYLIVDRRMSCLDAISESWKLTTGHAWQVFGLNLLGVCIGLLGLLCLVVGIIPAIFWVSCAMASLYHAVVTSKSKTSSSTDLPDSPISDYQLFNS